MGSRSGASRARGRSNQGRREPGQGVAYAVASCCGGPTGPTVLSSPPTADTAPSRRVTGRPERAASPRPRTPFTRGNSRRPRGTRCPTGPPPVPLLLHQQRRPRRHRAGPRRGRASRPHPHRGRGRAATGGGPDAADPVALLRRSREIETRRTDLARVGAALDDPEASAPLVAEGTARADQKRALESERADAAGPPPIRAPHAAPRGGAIAGGNGWGRLTGVPPAGFRGFGAGASAPRSSMPRSSPGPRIGPRSRGG